MRKSSFLNTVAGGALISALAGCAMQTAEHGPGTEEKTAAGLKLSVSEISRSVDLSRGREEFLTVSLDITSADPSRLRRVQPLRDDFDLLAGKWELPCRWLRGGTLPDDPSRLRFTLGFSMPRAGTRRVSLRVNLPRLQDDTVEVRLPDLQPGSRGAQRHGPGWSVEVRSFTEPAYEPPALPPSGRFISKAGPVDARIFRKEEPGKQPPRAVVLSLHSESTGLYDPTLDVSGHLLVDGGAPAPLLSAMMRRDPSRTVVKPPYGPFVDGQFYFALPPKGRAVGAVLRFHRRPLGRGTQAVTFGDLPVPGR
jgi:hypothetical protein